MDNNKSYIERRNRIKSRRSRRHIKPRKQWNSSLFFLRANICMGIAVVIIMASYIDTAPTNAFCNGVKNIIGKNLSVDEVKSAAIAIYSGVVQGDMSVMAGNAKHNTTLDSEIVEQINSRSNIYYNNQKKTN